MPHTPLFIHSPTIDFRLRRSSCLKLGFSSLVSMNRMSACPFKLLTTTDRVNISVLLLDDAHPSTHSSHILVHTPIPVPLVNSSGPFYDARFGTPGHHDQHFFTRSTPPEQLSQISPTVTHTNSGMSPSIATRPAICQKDIRHRGLSRTDNNELRSSASMHLRPARSLFLRNESYAPGTVF
jgi:hypothetical protein